MRLTWTPKEEMVLHILVYENVPRRIVAAALQRSIRAVWSKTHKLKHKLANQLTYRDLFNLSRSIHEQSNPNHRR